MVQIVNTNGSVIFQDASNGNFTIWNTITIASPNGGEIWSGGSNQIIKWRTTETGFARYRILFSRNGGLTYLDTVTHNLSPTETTYNWLLPSVNSGTCRVVVQILNVIDSVITQDASDRNFTIQTVLVVSPNGGEYCAGGSNKIIKWRVLTNFTFAWYRLLLSRDGGLSYLDTIVNYVVPAETTYNWLVPLLNVNTCRILVQILDEFNNIVCEDASNANFTIDSDPPSSFNLVLPLNNAWTNASPRFIWRKAIDNFAMSYYQLSIAVPSETLTINTQDTANPIPPTGSTWQQVTTSAQWTARLYHSSVVFNNKMWVIGGYDGGNRNDVWYSLNGINWTQATANAGWSARCGHTSVVFDNKMWVIGGYDGSNRNDIWYSSDGINWTCATSSAQWSPRFAHTSIVFDNKIWVLGGGNQHDVWFSSDGINWTCATSSAGWSPRDNHTSVVFDNKMWVIGGDNRRDAWYSTDGINWICTTTSAWYTIKCGHSSVVYDNKMWVIGGSYPGSDVWYSTNGINWIEATDYAEWSPRINHTSVVFKGMMWLIGGNDQDYNINRNDVWYAVSPPQLPEGQHTWWVTAYDRAGNARHSIETFLIRVDTTPPMTPVLVSPANGAFLPNPSVTFIWQHTTDNLSGLKEYQIQIANNSNFINATNIPTPDTFITMTLSDTANWWRVKAVDSVNNQSAWSEIRNVRVNLSVEEKQESYAIYWLLFRVYPNPAKSLTAIRYSIPVKTKVSLQLFDISGRLVKTLINERKNAGEYSTIWNGTDEKGRKVGEGVYFCIMKRDKGFLNQKILMVK